jgi:hypothetical protein
MDSTASGTLKLSVLVVFVCLALGLYAAATDLAIVWRWLLGGARRLSGACAHGRDCGGCKQRQRRGSFLTNGDTLAANALMFPAASLK